MRKIIQVDNDHVVFYELISIGNSTFLRDPVPHVLGEIHDLLHTKVPILFLLVWCMVNGLNISMVVDVPGVFGPTGWSRSRYKGVNITVEKYGEETKGRCMGWVRWLCLMKPLKFHQRKQY